MKNFLGNEMNLHHLYYIRQISDTEILKTNY